MRYIKSLAVVAIMALMAVVGAGSASATILKNGFTGEILGAGSPLDFNLLSGERAKLVDTEGGVLDECTGSTVKATLNSGVTGTIEKTTWVNCTFTTTTVTPGRLEAIWSEATKGTIRADAEIGLTINTGPFGSCIYGIENNTTLGTLTSFKETAAQFDVNAVAKKLSGSNIACPSTAKWTAIYVSSEPIRLQIEKE